MTTINRWLNIILDTTPRQWGQIIGDACAGSDLQLNRLTRMFILASIGLHIVVVAAVGLSQKVQTARPTKQIVEVEFGEMNAVRVARPEDAGFDQESNIVMRVPKKKAQQVETAARRLLDKYKKMRVAGLAGQAKSLSLEGSTAKARMQDYDDEDKGKDTWLKHLASYQSRLQSCYENALLADSSLAGRLRFVLKTDGTGHVAESDIAFQGVGMPGTKNNLIACLKKEVAEVRFPNEMRGAFNRRIGFEAVLAL